MKLFKVDFGASTDTTDIRSEYMLWLFEQALKRYQNESPGSLIVKLRLAKKPEKKKEEPIREEKEGMVIEEQDNKEESQKDEQER